MLRRSHKKSRGGCLECKRRHVKCDQNRPICRLCEASDRECNYASQTPPKQPNAYSVLSQDQPQESNKDYTPSNAPLTTASTSGSVQLPLHPFHAATSDNVINLDHMDLLIHVTQDSDIFNLGTGVTSYHEFGLALGLKEALKAPYLMYGLLAFSAQHLAFLRPERSVHYLHLAVSLQTRAISLFNVSWTEVNESNCVAVLLFSSVLAHHILADTLGRRDPGGLDSFLKYYVQCIEMSRGIYIIAKSAWPLLMASELAPIISLSAGFTSREPINDDCQHLQALIDRAVDMTDKERDACHLAVGYLQLGFDALLEEDLPDYNRYQMVYSWPMLVSSEVTTLLARKQPEALVILAHYAALLHHCSGLWQVGDAGAYIFGLVAECLGPEWDEWMRFARASISENLLSV